MKHPALTRVLAIVLVLLGLAMAAAGGLGLSRADRDRDTALDRMELLRSRAEEYRVLSNRLEGTESFESQSEALSEQQEQHDQTSSEHRVELTTYTATQYGLRMAAQAIEAAEREFQDYKYMFDRSLSSAEQTLGQLSDLLGQLWQLYSAAAAALNNATAHLNYAKSLVASLDAGEELTAANVVAAYDEALAALDEATGMLDTLHALEPTLDAIAAFDPSSLTELTDSMSQIPQNIDSLSEFELGPELTEVVQSPIDMEQLLEIKQIYNQSWAALKQALNTADEIAPRLEQQLQTLTGLNAAVLRAAAQNARDELAAQGDEPLDDGTAAAIRFAYAVNRDQIQGFLGEADSGLQQLNAYIGQAETLLNTVQGAVDALNGLMARARQMLDEGERSLYAARVTLWWQMGQQDEMEGQLRERRERLDQEAEQLQVLSNRAEEQKSAEQRLRTLRVLLLDFDGVRERIDSGETPDAAGLAVAEQTEAEAQSTWTERRRACVLMLAGAVCALLGIPAAFEQIRSRFLLLTPVLLCLGCAALAERILVQMGRGHSYSALVVMGFAALQLLVSAPAKRKKQTAGKHLSA